MVFLASIIDPDFGLFIWTVLIFLVFATLLGKFAFKPIANALHEREVGIAESLAAADKARAEMQNLQSENEALLRKAQEERSAMLKEAKEQKDRIVGEAKEQAKAEAQKIMNSAIAEIDNIKHQAMTDVKNQAGMLALDIAEKVLRKELKGDPSQVDFVNKLAKEITLN